MAHVFSILFEGWLQIFVLVRDYSKILILDNKIWMDFCLLSFSFTLVKHFELKRQDTLDSNHLNFELI